MTDILREPVRDDEGLNWELNLEFRSVDVFDVAAAGMDAMIIVGKRTKGAITQAKVDVAGANKGSVTLVDTVGAVPGVYKIICIEPDGGAGHPATFEVVDSAGGVVGVLVAGVPFEGPTGTITKAIGSADAAGDIASVTVAQAAGDGKVVKLARAGTVTDGTDEPYGISTRRVPQAAGVRKSVVITEFAVVSLRPGAYPAGASGPEKASIDGALLAKHIKVKPLQAVG